MQFSLAENLEAVQCFSKHIQHVHTHNPGVLCNIESLFFIHIMQHNNRHFISKYNKPLFFKKKGEKTSFSELCNEPEAPVMTVQAAGIQLRSKCVGGFARLTDIG